MGFASSDLGWWGVRGQPWLEGNPIIRGLISPCGLDAVEESDLGLARVVMEDRLRRDEVSFDVEGGDSMCVRALAKCVLEGTPFPKGSLLEATLFVLVDRESSPHRKWTPSSL